MWLIKGSLAVSIRTAARRAGKDDVDDALLIVAIEIRVKRQAQYFARHFVRDRQVARIGRRQSAIGRKLADERKEVATRRDLMLAQRLIKAVPAQRETTCDPYREVGIVARAIG